MFELSGDELRVVSGGRRGSANANANGGNGGRGGRGGDATTEIVYIIIGNYDTISGNIVNTIAGNGGNGGAGGNGGTASATAGDTCCAASM